MKVLVTMLPDVIRSNTIEVIPGQLLFLKKRNLYVNDEYIEVLSPKIDEVLISNITDQITEINRDILSESCKIGYIASDSKSTLGTYSNGRIFDRIDENTLATVKYTTEHEALLEVEIKHY